MSIKPRRSSNTQPCLKSLSSIATNPLFWPTLCLLAFDRLFTIMTEPSIVSTTNPILTIIEIDRDPTPHEVFLIAGPPHTWSELSKSSAWFSAFHFRGKPAFVLPFVQSNCVYSPVIQIPVSRTPPRCGRFTRGTNKYINAIQRGEIIPPVTFLFIDHRWSLVDGNHRYEAHIKTKQTSIQAIFAYPKRLLSP